MNKHLPQAALALAFALPCISNATERPLEEIIVTSSRVPMPLRQVGTSVSVVNAEEIQQLGFNSLQEILRLQQQITAIGLVQRPWSQKCMVCAQPAWGFAIFKNATQSRGRGDSLHDNRRAFFAGPINQYIDVVQNFRIITRRPCISLKQRRQGQTFLIRGILPDNIVHTRPDIGIDNAYGTAQLKRTFIVPDKIALLSRLPDFFVHSPRILPQDKYHDACTCQHHENDIYDTVAHYIRLL